MNNDDPRNNSQNKRSRQDADLSEVYDLYDFESLAKQNLDAGVYAYVATGGGSQVTFTDNNDAFDNIKLNPKITKQCPKA